MKRQGGFTLIELMVVIAILGILGATSIPFYRTYQQRVYRSEASLMVKGLLQGQIAYFLDHNKFFPEDGQTITIFKTDSPSKTEIQEISDALHVPIPVGRVLDYYIASFPETADDSCMIVVTAPFPLFQDGTPYIIGTVNRDGGITITTGDSDIISSEDDTGADNTGGADQSKTASKKIKIKKKNKGK